MTCGAWQDGGCASTLHLHHCSSFLLPRRWAFCTYDEDGDGAITVDELRVVLKDESPEKVQEYIREYDTNGDGKISYEVGWRPAAVLESRSTILSPCVGICSHAAACCGPTTHTQPI